MEEIRDTTPKPLQNSPADRYEEPDEINLYDYYLVIKKRWKLIALVFFVTTVTAGIASLLMTKIYRAETTILPIQSGSSGGIASMVGELSNLPFVTSMLPATSADKLVTVLQSRTIRENIIKKLDLMDILFADRGDGGILGESKPPTL
ncbi:MAG: hypothetical protein GTO24_24485, partial [candidate division Zixibacteria bacterium]|nr:hypothetical protein [candidate division Zixibacteria bacterium]